MTVRRDDDVLWLEGPCPVEEAETVVSHLASGVTTVDLRGCGRLHSAVVQALIAYAPQLRGAANDAFIRDFLEPALKRPGGLGQP
jgi:hypothetical protein